MIRERTIDRQPGGHRSSGGDLHALAILHMRRFECTADISSLDHSIEAMRNAVTRYEDPERRASATRTLADMLQDRGELTNSESHLREAAAVYKSAGDVP